MSFDIWNPFNGCFGKSEGCENCYAKTLDDRYGRDFFECKIIKSNFDYPIKRKRNGEYKVPSGIVLRVCMNCDFFYEGLDKFRIEAWDIMRQRKDITFYLLTKRPERVLECLPSWWNKKEMAHVMINATCENQKRTDERLPILKNLPFIHKGIMCAPLLEDINLEPYINEGWIENVNCGGENYNGARPCHYEWVKHLSEQCGSAAVKFTFIETGNNFYKDGNKIQLGRGRHLQGEYARSLNLNILEDKKLYNNFTPNWYACCDVCGSQPICMGCNDGKGACG